MNILCKGIFGTRLDYVMRFLVLTLKMIPKLDEKTCYEIPIKIYNVWVTLLIPKLDFFLKFIFFMKKARNLNYSSHPNDFQILVLFYCLIWKHLLECHPVFFGGRIQGVTAIIGPSNLYLTGRQTLGLLLMFPIPDYSLFEVRRLPSNWVI